MVECITLAPTRRIIEEAQLESRKILYCTFLKKPRDDAFENQVRIWYTMRLSKYTIMGVPKS
jgi:hypothetical protein